MKTQLRTKTNLAMAVMVGISASAILGAMAMIAVSAHNILTNKKVQNNAGIITSTGDEPSTFEDGFPVGIPVLLYESPSYLSVKNIALWENNLVVSELKLGSVTSSALSLIDLETRRRTSIELEGIDPKGYIDMNAKDVVFSAVSSTSWENNVKGIYRIPKVFVYRYARGVDHGILNHIETDSTADGYSFGPYNPAINASGTRAVWIENNGKIGIISHGSLMDYDFPSGIKTERGDREFARGPMYTGRDAALGKSDFSDRYRIYDSFRKVYIEDLETYNTGGFSISDDEYYGNWFAYYLHSSIYKNRLVTVLENGSSLHSGGLDFFVKLNSSDRYHTELQLRQFKIDSLTDNFVFEKRNIKKTRITGMDEPMLSINDTAIYGNKVVWIEDNRRVYVYIIPSAWRDLNACSDSDDASGDGINYYETGTVKVDGGSTSEKDFCVDRNNLTEYYCNNGLMVNTGIDCTTLGGGMFCSEGRCISSTTTVDVMTPINNNDTKKISAPSTSNETMIK